jgi:hypothetical protein
MNDFTPKEIKKASEYLQEKLEDLEKSAQSINTSDKIGEEVKQSRLKQFVSSIFKR